MRTLLLLALVSLLIGSSVAEKGIDISVYNGALSQSTFQCFKQQGYDFVIIQAWIENRANPQFQTALANAKAAGITHIDAYAFICNTCHNGQGGNVDNIVNSLKSTLGSFSGRVFLDIETCSGCWSSDGVKNFQFVLEVAEKIKNAGYHLGIYSSASGWKSIFGTAASKTTFSALPLWYAHYDNNPSFSDTSAFTFAGWTKPEIKQYAGDTTVCGAQVDLNFAGTSTPNTNSTLKNDTQHTNGTHPSNQTHPSGNKGNNGSGQHGGQTPKNQTQPNPKPKKQGGSGGKGGGSGGKGSGGKGNNGEQSYKGHSGEDSKFNSNEDSFGHSGENSFGNSGENSFGNSGENSFANSGEQDSSFGDSGENSFGGDSGENSFGNSSGGQEDSFSGDSGEQDNSFSDNSGEQDNSFSGSSNQSDGSSGGSSGDDSSSGYSDSGEDYFGLLEFDEYYI